MKKKKLLSVLVAAALSLSCFTAVPIVSQAEGATEAPVERVIMYRLYNPNSGEHFYTCDEGEKTDLVEAGWIYEGIGWRAPVKSDTPVYRLYNENAGDHHYTLSVEEKDNLISAGWNYEGIGWYSDDEKAVPLYREYNPNAVTGTHNYTADKAEHDGLVKAGWKDEGVGWYGIDKKPQNENLEIGDTVILGEYEQDNNSSNGKEDIEWLVLAKEGDKALVISKYALDSQLHNTFATRFTWETCSLRKWLNETFISNAFSSYEQNMIQKTIVTADKNPEYSTPSGNNTTDKVFLLSISEVNKYFSSDEARKCAATDYAKAQGAYTSDEESIEGEITCWWWLRSPGTDSIRAAGVWFDGSVDYSGHYGCSSYTYAVRPAMWIDLGY